jgi:hypothetical protein
MTSLAARSRSVDARADESCPDFSNATTLSGPVLTQICVDYASMICYIVLG